VTATCRPLFEVLGEVQNVRQARGKRYALTPILALACAAMLCGYRSYAAIAEWGHNYGAELAQALGFEGGKTPCAATFYYIFRDLEAADLEARLAAWAQHVMEVLPDAAQSTAVVEAVALDGKTLRGSAKQGAAGAHLLSAFSHRLGLTLGQEAVETKTNEISVVTKVLAGLVLEGRVLTMDALLTQRDVAQHIVQKGGTA